MGFYFRVVPGVRVRVTSRGVRTSVGPRAARLHVGAGRPGISAGAGPVSYYTSLSSSGTSRRTPARARSTSTAQRGPTAAQLKAAESTRLSAQFDEIYSLNHVGFVDAVAPMAPPPTPIDVAGFRAARRRDARHATSIFKLSERRAALREADVAAAQDARSAYDAAVEDVYAQQDELDTWWSALSRNDPEVVMGALAAAFEDNAARAAVTGVHGSEASLIVIVPRVEAVPERRPTHTAAGNLSLKKLTKTERAEAYKALLVGHVLLTVREAFAVAPGLTETRVLAVRMPTPDAFGNQHPEPLLAASFSRDTVLAIDWSRTDAAAALNSCAHDVLLTEKGTAHELQVLDLTHEPDLADALALITAEADRASEESPASARAHQHGNTRS